MTILGFRVAALLAYCVTRRSSCCPGRSPRAAERHRQDCRRPLLTVTSIFIMVVNVLVDASYGYLNPKLKV